MYAIAGSDSRAYGKEKYAQKKILNFLKSLRPEGYFFKVAQGPLSMAGISDILGCHRGRFFAFEVKSKTGKATRVQKHFLRMIAAAGGVTAVVRTLAEVKTHLNDNL